MRLRNLAVKISKRIIKYDDLVSENSDLKNENVNLINENEYLKKEVEQGKKVFGFPNGHYYSPMHNLEDLDVYDLVKKRSKSKFAKELPGFSEKRIKETYDQLRKFFKDYDYPKKEDGKSRFYIENGSYPITDSLVLFSMIRKLKPQRIIEIGSGFTSALMMDVNERFFDNKIDITFIEPYTELLKGRMKDKDLARYKIISKKAQDVPLKIFKSLSKNDILFVDSTHVSKFNSDVNYELFDILPELTSGVVIHFHDVFDGLEYPIGWLKAGWAWNEDYLLRAYFNGNNNYEILLMNDYLVERYPKLMLNSFKGHPNNCGGSLWIRKL